MQCEDIDIEGEVEDKVLVLDGWVGVERLDVVSEPSEYAILVGSLEFNERIQYEIYDENWYKIVNCDLDGYVPSQHILDSDTGYASYEQYRLDNIIGYTSYDMPSTSGFKSYMDYRTITSTGSAQYRLQRSYAKTGDYGIRTIEGRYCVALGSYVKGSIGQYLDLVLENGAVIPCILADRKSDAHTDGNNVVTSYSGCASEFVVDSKSLDSSAKLYGNISACNSDWSSPVATVKVYNVNIFD